jgi:hypothetical protein
MPDASQDVFPFRVLNQYREKARWKSDFCRSQNEERAPGQQKFSLLVDEFRHTKKRHPDQHDLEKKNPNEEKGKGSEGRFLPTPGEHDQILDKRQQRGQDCNHKHHAFDGITMPSASGPFGRQTFVLVT